MNQSNVSTYHGPERRTTDKRVIQALEVINILVGLCAVTALVISLTVQSDQLSTLTSARHRAAYDTCRAVKTLVIAAYSPHYRKDAIAVLASVGFDNCERYADHLPR